VGGDGGGNKGESQGGGGQVKLKKRSNLLIFFAEKVQLQNWGTLCFACTLYFSIYVKKKSFSLFC
jgi:hypothetical protein